MVDEQIVRVNLQRSRSQVQTRIGMVQGDERRETAGGQTDGAHLWEDADIRDADLGELTDELAALDSALQRLDQGSYGVCASCGEPIPEGRLEVMPYAVTCVECTAK